MSEVINGIDVISITEVHHEIYGNTEPYSDRDASC